MFHDVSDKKYSECLSSSIQVLKDHLKEIENIKFEYYEYEFKVCKDRISNYLDHNDVCYNEFDKLLRNLTIFIKEEYYYEDSLMIDSYSIYLNNNEKDKISQNRFVEKQIDYDMKSITQMHKDLQKEITKEYSILSQKDFMKWTEQESEQATLYHLVLEELKKAIKSCEYNEKLCNRFCKTNVNIILISSQTSYIKFLKNFSNIKNPNIEDNSRLIYTDYFSQKFDYVYTFESFIYLHCYDG
ncbi:6890_t:CDS:1 [Cetraspora pellucida]|uniref:6890_t:CDS:1 n=1 Tax=Cetraspora pellucida TaxID=1433469 RepID=A0A9N8YTS7_9GLOM|nr:6890_t:CDS:1 [Cetraspora pellucida]